MAGDEYIDKVDQLNRCMPVAKRVALGSTLQEMITAYNDLATKYNALLAKLDADAGVNDADYESTLAASDDDLADINDR